MAEPVCTIIGGPNGAGKTTFALQYLRDVGSSPKFVNADLIAAGLSPLSPEREWLAASRLFLSEIEASVLDRKDFAFETTLAGRSHLRLVHRLRDEGWQVRLIYLWLPDVSLAIERVKERVRHVATTYPRPSSRAVSFAGYGTCWTIARRYATSPYVSTIRVRRRARSSFVRRRDSRWKTPGCSGSWKPCDD